MCNGYMADSCEHGIDISEVPKRKCLEFHELLSTVAFHEESSSTESLWYYYPEHGFLLNLAPRF
jgi:hypothetical protein